MDVATFALLAAGLILWMALIHFLMALGVRRGELVWSGRQPRRLMPSLRWRSLFFAVMLVISAWVLAIYGGVISVNPVPARWVPSVGWTVTAFLTFTALYCAIKGSKWERIFFLPITLFGAILAGWLTFG